MARVSSSTSSSATDEDKQEVKERSKNKPHVDDSPRGRGVGLSSPSRLPTKVAESNDSRLAVPSTQSQRRHSSRSKGSTHYSLHNEEPMRCALLSGRHDGTEGSSGPDIADIAVEAICHECHPLHCEAVNQLEKKFAKDLVDRIRKVENDFNSRVEFEAQKKACTILAAESSALMHEQDERQMHIQRLENRVKTLEQQLHQARAEHRAVQASLQEDASVLAHRNADIVSQLDRVRLERKCAESKLKSTSEELTKLEIQRDKLSLQVIELTHQRDKMEAQIRSETGAVRRLSCDMGHLRRQLEVAHKEKAELEETLAKLEQLNMKAERDNLALTESNAELEAKYNAVQKKSDKLQAELEHLLVGENNMKPQLQEALEMLKNKGELEANLLQSINELKSQEHRLKAELACQAQRLAAKENVEQELWKLKKEYEGISTRLQSASAELTVLKAENIQAERKGEKAELEVRRLQNEQCLLKQEAGVLKKQVATIKQKEALLTLPGNSNAALGYRCGTKAPQISSPPVELPPRNEHLPSAGQLPRQPTTWDFHPPDGMGGAGANKIPSSRSNTESPAFPLPHPGEGKTGASSRGPTSMSEVRAPSGLGSGPEIDHLKLLHIQGLEKQLLVLQIEKNQLESDLARLPAATRGRTMKDRAQRLELDKRLAEVDASVLRVRKELRFNGAIGHPKAQYVA